MPSKLLVGLVVIVSIALAYAEDIRLAAEANNRYALAQLEFERELLSSDLEAIDISQLVQNEKRIGISISEVRGSVPELIVSNSLFISNDDHFASLDTVERRVSIAGRTYVVHYQARTAELMGSQVYRPVIILLGGLMLSLIIFGSFHMLWKSNQAAKLASLDQRHALAQSQERMRSLFDNAGDGICGLKTDGRIAFANPAAARILEASPKQLFDEQFFDFIDHDENDHITDEDSETSRKELRLTTVSGKDLFVDITITPRRNYAGLSTGKVVIFRDVTERIETDRQLRAANSELEEFAYRTSHDLRSPLVSAIGMLKIVHASVESGDLAVAAKGIPKTIKSLASLEQLVGDILTLTRTRAEQETVELIDLDLLVKNTLNKLEQLDGFSRIRINCDHQLGTVWTMPNRIELIVSNLLSNAVKYHDPAHQQPQIWISTYAEGNGKILRIEDNGIGIPKAQRKNLFAMFKRFHPRVSFGSGIGLYMVKKSAEIIGADVRYDICQRGTRFSVLFPNSSLRENARLVSEIAA